MGLAGTTKDSYTQLQNESTHMQGTAETNSKYLVSSVTARKHQPGHIDAASLHSVATQSLKDLRIAVTNARGGQHALRVVTEELQKQRDRMASMQEQHYQTSRCHCALQALRRLRAHGHSLMELL